MTRILGEQLGIESLTPLLESLYEGFPASFFQGGSRVNIMSKCNVARAAELAHIMRAAEQGASPLLGEEGASAFVAQVTAITLAFLDKHSNRRNAMKEEDIRDVLEREFNMEGGER